MPTHSFSFSLSLRDWRLKPQVGAQGALQQKLKTLALERKNEQRSAELAAVVKQAELQRAQKQVKQLAQELKEEQAVAERAARRAALEYHNQRKVSHLRRRRLCDEVHVSKNCSL